MGLRRPSASPVASQMPPRLPFELCGTALQFHPDLSYLNEINRGSSRFRSGLEEDVIAQLNNEAHHLLCRRLSLTYEKITEALGSRIGE